MVCDYPEERWYSMDLVADMLLEQFSRLPAAEVEAQRVRPQFRRFLAGRKPSNAGALFNAERLLNRFFCYPRHLGRMKTKFDIFHVVDHSYAQLVRSVPAGRTVVTCHDLDAFRSLYDPAAEPRPAWFRSLALRILQGLQAASHVVFVSKTVQEEAVGRGLVCREKTSVVPNGVHPSCTVTPAETADQQAASLLDGAGESLLLLHVGSTIPRKRVDILLRTFQAIRQEVPVKLVRVGGPLTAGQKDLARELDVLEDIVELPFLERDVLAAVYRRCDLLLITSEREGFGLPVAEALACGCPVVASDLPVLREVGGSSAEYVSLGDRAAWKSVILMLAAERLGRPEAWRQRQRAAAERGACFTWRNTAQQLVELYGALV